MSKLSDKDREKMPEGEFAFPKERKEPLSDARHVQEAVARFDQVQGVTNKERDEAWKRIQQSPGTKIVPESLLRSVIVAVSKSHKYRL